MKAVTLRLVLAVLVLAGVLVGCSAGKSGGDTMPEDAAFKVTGLVDKELGWTEDELRSMDTIEAEYTNKDGETKTYTGVPINALLDKTGLKGDATSIAFVADDGYIAEATADEVKGCADCIVSFRDEGGFSLVMPGFSGKLQVKGVTEIQAK